MLDKLLHQTEECLKTLLFITRIPIRTGEPGAKPWVPSRLLPHLSPLERLNIKIGSVASRWSRREQSAWHHCTRL